MHDRPPRVSIGLPVYNGEDYLPDAIDSILAQTYEDFELIISDNGSSDRTEQICRDYESKDSRVRSLRTNENLGASWNFNFVFELAYGEYFKWAAHDDICAPTFLEECVAVLDDYPDVVLCYTQMVDIDKEGVELGFRKPIVDFDMKKPHSRFRDLSLLHPSHTCEEIFGLIRSEILRKTRLIGDYSDSDRTLLTELGLFGPFYEIPEVLFRHRVHLLSSVAVNPDRSERMAWFEPTKKGWIVFPHWHQFRDLLSVIWQGPISWSERSICYLYMFRWLYRARIRLARDLVLGIQHIF